MSTATTQTTLEEGGTTTVTVTWLHRINEYTALTALMSHCKSQLNFPSAISSILKFNHSVLGINFARLTTENTFVTICFEYHKNRTPRVGYLTINTTAEDHPLVISESNLFLLEFTDIR